MPLPAIPDYDELVDLYADTGVSRDAPHHAELPCLTLDAIAACVAKFGHDSLDLLLPGALAQAIMLAAPEGRRAVAERVGFLVLEAIEQMGLPAMSRDVRSAMAEMRAQDIISDFDLRRVGHAAEWRFPRNWL